MLKIFLSSHGHLASGMKSSLDILMGSSNNVTVYDAYVDETCVKDKLDEFYQTVKEDDQVLLLSDLYGGSVNQAMFLYLDKPNTYLVAGVNLALVLELAVKTEINEDILQEVVEQSRSMMLLVKQDGIETSDEENDFF